MSFLRPVGSPSFTFAIPEFPSTPSLQSADVSVLDDEAGSEALSEPVPIANSAVIQDLSEKNLTDQAFFYLKELGWSDEDLDLLAGEAEEFYQLLFEQAYENNCRDLVEALPPHTKESYIAEIKQRMSAFHDILFDLDAESDLDRDLYSLSHAEREQMGQVFLSIVPGKVNDAQRDFLVRQRGWTEAEIMQIEESGSVDDFIGTLATLAVHKLDTDVIASIPQKYKNAVRQIIEIGLVEREDLLDFLGAEASSDEDNF